MFLIGVIIAKFEHKNTDSILILLFLNIYNNVGNFLGFLSGTHS